MKNQGLDTQSKSISENILFNLSFFCDKILSGWIITMLQKSESKIYIIGAGFAGQMIVADLQRKKVFGEVAAFLDDDENLIGKQITKAVFTSAILCAVVYCLEYFGFLVIVISADSLAAYLPLALVSLLLWFFIGFFL